jgi:hypothetical protein
MAKKHWETRFATHPRPISDNPRMLERNDGEVELKDRFQLQRASCSSAFLFYAGAKICQNLRYHTQGQ